MAEAQQTRYPCAQCGAELNWSPGQGSLECPYCGHKGEAEQLADAGPYVATEHRMDQAALQAAKGWGKPVTEFQCNTCGAISEVDAHVTATSCAFCGSDELAAEDDDPNLIRPESVIPFTVDRDKAIADFKGWISGLWFRPSALKQLSRLNKINGVYIPSWTYDAETRSHWTAERGDYYYVDETYMEDGQRKTRKVRKTRWSSARGRKSLPFDDVLISASKGLEQGLFDGVAPFTLGELKPYDTQFLANFTAERYQIDLAGGYETAQGKMRDEIRSACARDVPGDTHRNLKVQTHFSDVTFKHILLPIWIAAYEYQGEIYRYLVNGQTGKTHGTAPYSWFKIGAAILVLLIIIGVIVAISQSR